MKTQWDYTDLAEAYLKRPQYSDEAIDGFLSLTGCVPGAAVCDVGAGVAHLTLKLADRGFKVTAVEPNDAMRERGIRQTAGLPDVRWFEGTGERTGQASGAFDMVTFGSSFNVTDRQRALRETKRLLKPRGWFAAMWNHRDLEDPVQAAIEGIIKQAIPDYGYGTRREDQSAVIAESGLFEEAHRIEGGVVHTQTVAEMVEAWRSHATLHRQAGDRFPGIIESIERMLKDLGRETIDIPYTTRLWAARLR
ncbi:methyltransferase [bacterium DOLZORAL124_64_63]|nr:MAG: methyltransferase [bacterium DOLZORAL124_64_63]